MNIIVQRSPADKQGPDIVNSLLTTEDAGRARGVAEINYNESDRLIVTGNGPKNDLMYPTKLVQVTDGERQYRGVITNYSRSYNISEREFSITTSVSIEVLA